MERVFFIPFAVGVIYTLITFILGHVLSFSSGSGDIDVDIDWEDMGFFDIPISPLRPVVIASFITVFGGTGLLAYKNHQLPFILSLFLAFVSAFVVSFLLYRFIVVPLYRAQNTSAHDINLLQGTDALVTSSIYGEHFGRIRYVVNDNTYSAPAKSIKGVDIKQGEKVIIVEVDKKVFYVDRL